MKNKLLYIFMALMLCYFNMESLAQVSVSVSWGANQGKTSTGKSFGINCNRFFDPNVTNNSTYLSNLQFMNPKFVRFHDWAVNGWEIPGEKGWMDANEEWNAAKVIQALTPFKNNFPNMEIIMNIAQWPTKFMIDPSFNANGYFGRFNNARLRTDKYDAFAAWCASLLTICKNNGFNVKYWELPNEQEDLYPPTNTSSNNAICEIYRKATKKLKETDPTIKTGGLSFTNDNGVVEFLSQVANQSFLLNGQTAYYVDFFAQHIYPEQEGSGLGQVFNGQLVTDQKIYDNTNTYFETAQVMSNRASTYGTSHNIEKYLDEFAVSYNDQDIVHSAYTTAVYHALAYFKGLLGGLDGMHDWNDINGGFGLQDDSYNLRPRAYTLHMLTNHMIGTLVNTSSSNIGVVSYGVKNGNSRAVMLINTTASAQNVAINFSGWGTTPSSLNTKRIRPSGVGREATYETGTVAYSNLTSSYALPANSVTTVYVTDGGGGNVPVTGVSLSPTSASIAVGATQQLTAIISPANATNQGRTWSSSNTSVATVNSTGLVTGAAAGTATITATTADGSFTATSSITVTTGGGGTTPIIKLAFNENTGTNVANTGSAGGTLSRTAATPAWSTNTPAGPGGTSSVDFGTTTGDFVVESGAAIGQIGGLNSFTITGWINNRSTTTGAGGNRVISWINNGGDGVDLVYNSDGSLQLGIDEWPDASPAVSSASKITTSSTAAAANWRFFAVTYNSANNTVQYYFGTTAAGATLDVTRTYNRGAVGTAIGRLAIGHFNTATRGVATDRMLRGLIDNVEVYGSVLTAAQVITAQARNSSNVAVTGASVSPTSASRTVGQTVQLTATVSPANATNQAVSWGSSNTTVASVNSSGLVTANAVGTTTITVTTADGGFTATSAITVTAANVPVTGVSLSPTSASIAVGATQQLTATISPANATNQGRTWSSSNTSVATVNSTGLVTGAAAGTATITATTADGSFTATSAITVTTGGGGNVYYVYSDAGNNFTPDGGSLFTYSVTATNLTTGAPEGANFRRLTVAGDYMTYQFVYGTAKNKSSWSGANIQFSIKTTQDFDFFMEDFAGNRVDIALGSYMTKSGNWESVSIPVSAFSGVNLSQLKGYGFYNTWNATKSLDFDNLRITGTGAALRISQNGNNLVEQPISNTVIVFPNPTRNEIKINLGNLTNATIQVFDVTGKLLQQRNNCNNRIEKLALGKYKGQVLIKITTTGSTIAKKVMVQ